VAVALPRLDACSCFPPLARHTANARPTGDEGLYSNADAFPYLAHFLLVIATPSSFWRNRAAAGAGTALMITTGGEDTRTRTTRAEEEREALLSGHSHDVPWYSSPPLRMPSPPPLPTPTRLPLFRPSATCFWASSRVTTRRSARIMCELSGQPSRSASCEFSQIYSCALPSVTSPGTLHTVLSAVPVTKCVTLVLRYLDRGCAHARGRMSELGLRALHILTFQRNGHGGW